MSPNFVDRHIGPNAQETAEMLKTLGFNHLSDFVSEVIPSNLLATQPYENKPALSEAEFSKLAQEIGSKNKVLSSYIGQGYYNTITPGVILRNIFQSPAWYTAYTPYQSEISQGRLEAILNFQTMVMDLTGMDIANASLLDEGTAAAEAMSMCRGLTRKKGADTLIVDENVFAQTVDVLKTRAWPLNVNIKVVDLKTWEPSAEDFALVAQYPNSLGEIENPESYLRKAQAASVMTICCTDLLALTQIEAPGVLGFDVAVGNSQRFGVPLGFGGPHAAFFATKDAFKRSVPGRLIGVSTDRLGKPALRMALQTREQHIRREKATSNICTAQVLLAVMASMYAVYHGPVGLKSMAQKINAYAQGLKVELEKLGYKLANTSFFDTLSIIEGPKSTSEVQKLFIGQGINVGLWKLGWQFSVDETWTDEVYTQFLTALGAKDIKPPQDSKSTPSARTDSYNSLSRKTEFLTHPVFNSHHSETQMLRYIYGLQGKDLTLTHSMIPLGSCTMKLNATSEMQPVTDAHWSQLHPFIPEDQHLGYDEMFARFESRLNDLTGFSAFSFQPNAGSQGEYAGLLTIKKYLEDNGQGHRNVCLIPSSAHGTNPASAAMCGFKVVVVKCDEDGNIDLTDLQTKCIEHKDSLAALMVTYPSTHGVFEREIKSACTMVHESGGQVYLDGANMNALVGFIRPAELGADVAHLNLHKTFCIPHGGGGPGVGPIGVAAHLVPYLPGHGVKPSAQKAKSFGPVCSAPWGSASIIPISWAYVEMMGSEGLKKATEYAILNANYIAQRLKPYYPIVFTGPKGFVAHECIIDLRGFKTTADVTVDDFAKRLMDFGFHSPTMSWPVAGTLMIEPTESESKAELDRFCDAMIQIYNEVKKIEAGEYDRKDNPLTMAPHTVAEVTSDHWDHPYSRKDAAYPLPDHKLNKFWTTVSRVDNASGDRNLVCSCPPLESYT
ncbi:MAG: aminomethyl-transferring glycine dehydrogenase [Bdellovibrionaceae bacterium]|nr:aminomethyl-transferring glycine dehydrogenase [Pseudobdellovibrionaceae bacterium]